MISIDSNIFSIHPIETVQIESFFELIERNRKHLQLGFPYTILKCDTLASTELYIQECTHTMLNKKGYFFYLKDIKTKKLMGYVIVKNMNPDIPKCELAYFIDKSFEGKGITSTAVASVVRFSFESLKMNKIFICTDRNNIGSQKVALKNGFLQEGILRNEFKNTKGILNDVVYFGLLRSDYYQNEG